MTSKIKVDNINKVSDDSNIIKKCGTTTTIGSGASNPIVVDGSTVTLGRCGGTVALASGATQTGFGRTGTVDWQTSSIKTATFTAANGEGYFANTSGGVFTMNLPAGTAGNIVSVVDYTNTFQTNALTVAPNGSQKIGGIAASIALTTEGQSVTLVYVDDIEGWKNTMDSTSNVTGRSFISATGGTVTCSGNCKIHTFTGPGTFCVSSVSTVSTENQVSFLVIGGGAGGATYRGGGGGAGGFREFKGPHQCYSVSPLNGATPVSITATGFPITVGAGGAATSNGNTSIFSTITSAAGGQGSHGAGGPGGSGGGASSGNSGGTGNTPVVSPPQGTGGGPSPTPGAPKWGAGAGGGAIQPGDAGTTSGGGNGGNGTSTSITGSPVTRAGGGGGGAIFSAPSPSGGSGGGGPSPSNNPGVAGTVNTGSGGGGANNTNDGSGEVGGAGGSGIVVIRYKYQ